MSYRFCILDAIKSFGLRVQLVGFIPTALAIAIVVVMADAHAPDQPLTFGALKCSVGNLGPSGISVIVAIAAAISITLAPLQFRLVQWFEGYWSFNPRRRMRPLNVLRPLYRLGLWRQRRRYRRVITALVVDEHDDEALALARAETAADDAQFRFPQLERLLPTTLGNVLRAAEDRAGVRYGIDSIALWPRLHALLPTDLAAGIEDEVTQLDVSVRLVLTWLSTGIIGAVMLGTNPTGVLEHPGWLVVVAAMFLLAQLSYRGAVESALAHGRDIEVAIDLYRSKVLDIAHLPVPTSLSQERQEFTDLIALYNSDSADEPAEMLYRTEPPPAAH